MKKIFPAFLILFLSFPGCRKDLPDFLFQMDDQRSFSMPAGLNLFQTHYFQIANVPSQFQQFLQEKQLTQDKIQAVVPAKARMYAPASSTSYEYVSKISVWIVSQDGSGEEKELFYLDEVPFNVGNVIQLNPTENDIKSIISKTKYTLQVRLNFREAPPETLDHILEYSLGAY